MDNSYSYSPASSGGEEQTGSDSDTMFASEDDAGR